MVDWRKNIDEREGGVWRFRPFFSLPDFEGTPLSLGDQTPNYVEVSVEGTPFTSLICQREDLNTHGSHKDRSLSVQVNAYRHESVKALCISSSGNAAIAAAAACAGADIPLFAFMSPDTSPGKIAAVCQRGAHVILSERAIGLSKELSSNLGIPNLRPSVDDRALEGYKALAFYLAETGRWKDVDSLFCYTTSGSTLCGIWRGFQWLAEQGWEGKAPALHAAQAGAITGIAERFGEKPAQAGRSVIGDLGTRRTRRLGELVRSIRASGGHGWAVSDSEILESKEWLGSHGLSVCLESACAMAACFRAGKAGKVQRPLVLLTGLSTRDEGAVWPEEQVFRMESQEDFLNHFGELL